jgi:hypothetical protein
MIGTIEKSRVSDMLLDIRNCLVDQIGISDQPTEQYGLDFAVTLVDNTLKELKTA